MAKSFSAIRALLASAMIFIGFAPATAAELAKPKGEIILSVTGKITQTNAPGRADFDRDMLTALGVSTIRTSHSWADSATDFEGVLASRLLTAVGAKGAKIKATAINNYAIELETAELMKTPVLLALKANGADLRRRDRGPIWIIYPRDEFPEFKAEKHNFKWIWQLRSLDIE